VVTKDSAFPATHRLGILLTPDKGRLLICDLCQLSFPFPQAESYDAVSRQFDSLPCAPDEPLFATVVGQERLRALKPRSLNAKNVPSPVVPGYSGIKGGSSG
jgi:hypothetical protein